MDTCWSIFPHRLSRQACSKKCDGREGKVITGRDQHTISHVDLKSGCAYCPEGKVPRMYWHDTKISLNHTKTLIRDSYVPSREPLRSLKRQGILVKCVPWQLDGKSKLFLPDMAAYKNKECDRLKAKRGVNVMLSAAGKSEGMMSSPNLKNNYNVRCNV